MRTRTEAMAELRDLADRVASARRAIANGEVARVVGIENDIDAVCQVIIDLPYEEALALRPALKALQADLTALFAEMESVRDQFEAADADEELGEEEDLGFEAAVPPGRTVH